MKRVQFIFGILCLLAVGARGEVPSTLTYQGRLYKGGIGAAGKKLMSFALVNSSGSTPLGSFNVDVPVTGEFSVSIPLPVDYDWAGNPPKLEVSVDGEKLSPLEIFSVTPYSLVTKKVDINGVDTGALKDEAVTTEKIKSVSAEKVLLGSGQPIGRWEKGTTGFIDAAVIIGTVPASVTDHGVTHRAGGMDPITELSPSQITGTGMVLKPTVSQTVEPVGAATDTFVVKGSLGASEDKFYPLRVYGTQTPKQEEQFSVRGDGQTYFKGNVGIGTNSPTEKLTVAGNLAASGNVAVTGNLTAASANVPNVTATQLVVSSVTANEMSLTSASVSSITVSSITIASATINSLYMEPWREVGTTGQPKFDTVWVNFDSKYPSVAFAKDSMGFVHIKGHIKNTANHTPYSDKTSPVFTLPVGYRPKTTYLFDSLGFDGGYIIFVQISIGPGGDVRVHGSSSIKNPIPTGSNVAFSGFYFKAEQ